MRNFLLAICWLCAAAPTLADFDEAMALYQKGRFDEAFPELRRLAELGDHTAQFNLGVMYFRGEGGAADFAQAYAWMALGAENNPKQIQARDYLFEALDADARQKALQRKDEVAALYGDEKLYRDLAPELVQDVGDGSRARVVKKVAPSYPMAMMDKPKTGWVDLIFSIAADGTTRNHGILAMSDKDFIASALAAIKAWQFEPTRIDGKAVETYGETLRVLYTITGAKFSEQKVRDFAEELRVKAENGSQQEQFQYAYYLKLLPSYTDIKLDHSEATQWYWRSASGGFAKAQFELGKDLLVGRGCRADTVKSLVWLERAAAKGLPDAQYLLATEMLTGARLAKNEPAAFKWLEKAAEHDTKAQMKLAWLFATYADEKLRDGRRAAAYLDKIEDYIDKLTWYETRAAVYAELGDFKQAEKWQRKAHAEAKKYDLPLDVAQARLDAYQQRRTWVE